jgi:hypothetical protein
MNKILTLLVIFLVGCASSGSQSSSLDACNAQVNSQHPSGPGNSRNRAQGFINCERLSYGNLPANARPLFEEYWAYWMFMAAEVDARRISREQGQYQLQQKKNELIRQIQAQSNEFDRQQQTTQRPRCSSLPPGLAGYEAARGNCY